MKVLLVDDDRLALLMLGEGLLAGGLNVVTADSAEQALADLDRGTSFDVIVSDIQMPGMDGMALATRVRQLQHDNPHGAIAGSRLMALTGSINCPQDKTRILTVFDQVVCKPVTAPMLLGRLQALFDNLVTG